MGVGDEQVITHADNADHAELFYLRHLRDQREKTTHMPFTHPPFNIKN